MVATKQWLPPEVFKAWLRLLEIDLHFREAGKYIIKKPVFQDSGNSSEVMLALSHEFPQG